MGQNHYLIYIFLFGCIINFPNQLHALYISSEFPFDTNKAVEYRHSVYRTKDEWTSWSGLAFPYDRELGFNLTSRGCIIAQIPGTSDKQLIEKCKNEGASAVITILPFSEEPGFTTWTYKDTSFGIPAVELTKLAQNDIKSRLSKKEPLFISFSKEDDTNKWYDAFRSGIMIWFSVSLSAISLVNIVLSAWRLYNYISKYGVTFSLSQTIIGICLASNIVNLIIVSIDPIYSRAIFGYIVSSLLLTITYPVILITTLLITFYWHEIMTINSTKVYLNLRRKVFVIPLITFSIILFLLQIAGSLARGLRFNINRFIVIASTLFIIQLTSINIYCLVIGYRVSKKIKESAGVNRHSSRKNKLLHVTNYVMISSICSLFSLPCFIIIMTDIFRIPHVFIITLYFVYFFIIVGDTFKILAFGLPSTKINSTKKSISDSISSNKSSSNV